MLIIRRACALLLIFFTCSVIGGGISWDSSCKNPIPGGIVLQDLKNALAEGLAMASLTESALNQAPSSPSSTGGKRINYILKTLLATSLTSPLYPTVQKSFSSVSDLAAGRTPYNLKIYCSEDFIKKAQGFFTGPFLDPHSFLSARKPQCPTNSGLQAYTFRGRYLVLCPRALQAFGSPDKLVIGSRRDQSLNGQFLDKQFTMSGLILHELLHAASYGLATSSDGKHNRMSVLDVAVDKGISVSDLFDQDPNMRSAVIKGYAYSLCRYIAGKDSRAQHIAGAATTVTSAIQLILNTRGPVPADTPGIAVVNCDSLRIVSLQIWLIHTDLVGTGKGKNYNANGFTSSSDFRYKIRRDALPAPHNHSHT